MSTLARRDTKPEVLLRSELHRRGLRYPRADEGPGNNRRTIDIAFTRVRLAVYVDGVLARLSGAPRAAAGQQRLVALEDRAQPGPDADTDRELREAGWEVLRIWEHVPAVRGG